MAFFVVLVSLLVPVIAIQIQFQYRRRTLSRRTWEAVLNRAECVDLTVLHAVAQLDLKDRKNRLHSEASDLWEIVGGFKGLARLQKNAAAMLQLAVYAESLNGEQGHILVEAIRRDAVRLKQSITRTRFAYALHLGRRHKLSHLKVVASAYFDVRNQLMGLYQQSQGGLLPRLEAAF